jgi:hypothetical protein
MTKQTKAVLGLMALFAVVYGLQTLFDFKLWTLIFLIPALPVAFKLGYYSEKE